VKAGRSPQHRDASDPRSSRASRSAARHHEHGIRRRPKHDPGMVPGGSLLKNCPTCE
jgi:hypothetical protein